LRHVYISPGQTGYYGADPQVFERLKSVIEGGFDPIDFDLGRIVMAAVKRNDFWILPFPEFTPAMEERNREIITALKQV
jgi:hypothetical protein